MNKKPANNIRNLNTRIVTIVLALCCVAEICRVSESKSFGQTIDAIEARTAPLSESAREKSYAELRLAAAKLDLFSNVVKEVVRIAKPTVVHIEVRRFSGDDSTSRSTEEAGSGVIIKHKDKFYVLTNRHVVKNASTAQTSLKLFDGRILRPQKILTDPETDVAVLLVSGKNLVASHIGDSDKVVMGDFVLAIGSPFGLSHSATFGMISAKGRRDLILGTDGVRLQDFMQTDTAINPGNSGGPLLNLRAEVIGLNSAIASASGRNEGIGFSIPINMVMTVARQLIDHGKVSRAFLGVNLDGNYGAAAAARIGLPRPIGALVRNVTDRSPASLAKIEAGDVILTFDGKWVEDDNHLVSMVGLTQVDKKVKIKIFRKGKTRELQVIVSDRKDFRVE